MVKAARPPYSEEEREIALLRLPAPEPPIFYPAVQYMHPSFHPFEGYYIEEKELNVYGLEVAVESYERHLFLCHNFLSSGPSHVENAYLDSFPSAFLTAFKARETDMKIQTLLNICDGSFSAQDGSFDIGSLSNGDVIVFPEMVVYRDVREYNMGDFLKDVLAIGYPVGWIPQQFIGSFIFVCVQRHTGQKRCFRFGTILIYNFNEEIIKWGLNDRVFVTAFSTGGKCCDGNVIIFSPNSDGKIVGNWYGLVESDDVPELFFKQIVHGLVVGRLWRGQMSRKVERVDESKADDRKVERVDESKADDEKETGHHFCWTKKLGQHRVLATVAVACAVATICLTCSFYRKSM